MKRNNLNLNILSRCDYKILYCLYLLNNDHVCPNNIGLYNVLTGREDAETLKYSNYPCYHIITSYSRKRISQMVNILIRYKYIMMIYDKNSDSLYLKLSELGENFITTYLENHTITKSQKREKTISNFFHY